MKRLPETLPVNVEDVSEILCRIFSWRVSECSIFTDQDRVSRCCVFMKVIKNEMGNPGSEAVTAFCFGRAGEDQSLRIDMSETSCEMKVAHEDVHRDGFFFPPFNMRLKPCDEIFCHG